MPIALLLTCLVAMLASESGAAAAGRNFEDTAQWARRFDSEARDAWQQREEVLRVLALAPDFVVADIGAGTGYFAVRLAAALPQGRVYAVDLEPEMVQHLRGRAAASGITNMHPVQASRDDPRLPEPVDVVLLVNVQGLLVNSGDYFARLRASLKPGARVAILAARPGTSFGPPAQMRVPAQKVKADMAVQGYMLVAEHDFLPYQFFLVFAAAP